MSSLLKTQEELGAIRVGAWIRHGKDRSTRMFVRKVLIGKFRAVDWLASSSIAIGDVASLGHKARNHAMEDRILEAKIVFVFFLIADAQSVEIWWSNRRVAI